MNCKDNVFYLKNVQCFYFKTFLLNWFANFISYVADNAMIE